MVPPPKTAKRPILLQHSSTKTKCNNKGSTYKNCKPLLLHHSTTKTTCNNTVVNFMNSGSTVYDYFFFRAQAHCKWERSVLALNMGPLGWVKYIPIFESNLAFLKSGQTQSNYSEMFWTQGLKWVPAWARIAFWLGWFGLNCAQMAPGGAESDFGQWGLNWQLRAETDLFNLQCSNTTCNNISKNWQPVDCNIASTIPIVLTMESPHTCNSNHL